jgi:hypothetical protein
LRIRVRSSQEADRYVRERGGVLYVWLEPLGGRFSRLSVGTERPGGEPDLEPVHAGGFELFLDRNLERPNVLDVELRRWPWSRIRVRGLRVHGLAVDPLHTTPEEHVLWDSAGGADGGGGGGNGGGGNGGGGG